MAGGFYAVVLLVVKPPAVFGAGASAQALNLTMFHGVGVVCGPLIGDYRGQSLLGMKPNEVCRAGEVRTFQVERPFLRVTMRQNVIVGAHVAAATGAEAEVMRM